MASPPTRAVSPCRLSIEEIWDRCAIATVYTKSQKTSALPALPAKRASPSLHKAARQMALAVPRLRKLHDALSSVQCGRKMEADSNGFYASARRVPIKVAGA
jgi:hypothetical protein